VQVDYTLPVAPNGLESNAQNLLKDGEGQGRQGLDPSTS